MVQFPTNFGGGKTHLMLALYHLFSGVAPGELLGIDAVLAEAGVGSLPQSVKRVVLVGNKISPGNPSVKADGTVVHTLWGEGSNLITRLDVFDVRRRSVARYEGHVEPGHRPAGTASSARAPRAPARVHDATPPQSRDSGQLTIQLMPKRSVHMPK